MAVTPAEALACLTHFERQYFDRYDRKSGPLHALLAVTLFQRAHTDYTRAAKGSTYRPRPLSPAAAITLLSTKRAFSEDTFRGNDRPQLSLATVLSQLGAYETPDGRLLSVVGPEHKRGGNVELYLIVVEGAAQARSAGYTASPVEEHEARVQRVAALIAAWIARQLLRRPPADVKRLEQHAKKRGVKYALAAFFGFVACTGTIAAIYRLSLHDIAVRRVECVMDPLPTGGEPRATYAVVWERGSRPIEDYFVLRDGEDVTDRKRIVVYPLRGTDICVFIDGKPRPARDVYYRVGYGRGIGRKVSAPIPTDHARCDEVIARVHAGVPLHARTLDAASVGAFLADATTVSVGSPVSFYFPFVRKETVGAQIDPRSVGELLQSQRVVLDFGDGTRAVQPANAIRHTFHRPGRYTVTAHDPSRTSDQQFTAVVVVTPQPAHHDEDKGSRPPDLCHGEGPNCHTLPLADIPAAALPYAIANVSNAPTVAARRGDEISFVLAFEGVEAPAQFGLGSTLVSFFGDGTKSITHYDTLRGPGYPMEQHRWMEAGTFALHSCLVRRTGSGPMYACAFATIKVQ